MTRPADTRADFESLLSTWLEATAPDREPVALLDRTLEHVAATRRRPAWWRPGSILDVVAPPRVVASRAFALVGLLVLLAIAGAYVLAVAARPHSVLPLGRPGLLVLSRPGELILVDPAGSVHGRATTGDLDGVGSWSRDGTRMARGDGRPTAPFLVISGPDLREQFRIALPLGSLPFFSWSPDGRRITFGTETDTTAQVYVVDVAAGAVPTPITPVVLDALAPTWSPDGSLIAFRGGVELDQQALYVMHPDGSEAHRISQQARAVEASCGFAWTPDSSSIAFATRYNGVWMIDANGAHERVVVGGTASGFCPSVSPDGLRVAAIVDRNDGRGGHLEVIAADGITILPKQPTSIDGWPAWSPDAQLLAINRRELNGNSGPVALIDPTGVVAPVLLGVDTSATVTDWQRLDP